MSNSQQPTHAPGCDWWHYQDRPGSTVRECTCGLDTPDDK